MHRRFLALVLLGGTGLGLAPPAQPAQENERDDPLPDDPIRALFLEHCAPCHGETGDGKGWTELDRPARSFRDGGFSYGNTQGAIARTLSTGIPGTPMPSFDGTLDEDQRKLMADYVITLGPPVTKVERSDTILELGERPVIVRGMLPPIAAGAQAHTRGLLIGMPSGMTFEYRTDDVRLLGLRQGEFCERTDWVGRGGTELAPLGKVVHLLDGGDPRPTFRDASDLAADMRGSWIERLEDGSWAAGLRYLLSDGEGPRANVREAVDALSTKSASGFRRSFSVELARAGDLRLRLRHPGEGRLVGTFPIDDVGWLVMQREDGFFECRGYRGAELADGPLERIELGVAGSPGDVREIDTYTLVTPEWTPEVRTELRGVAR